MRLDRLASRIERLDARVAETRTDAGDLKRSSPWWTTVVALLTFLRLVWRLGNRHDPAGMAFGPLARKIPVPVSQGLPPPCSPVSAGRSLVPGFAPLMLLCC